MRKSFVFKIQAEFLNCQRKDFARGSLHTIILWNWLSVFKFTTIKKKKTPLCRTWKHGSADTSNSQKSLLTFPDGLLILTRPKYRQMKCQSFHQQYLHSPPFSQGRIYCLSSRHAGKNRVTGSVCLHLSVHQVSFQGIVKRSKIGHAAQAFEAGRVNTYANVSSWKQSDLSTSRQHRRWFTLEKTSLYIRSTPRQSPMEQGLLQQPAPCRGLCGRGRPGQPSRRGLLARRNRAQERCRKGVKGKKPGRSIHFKSIPFFLSKRMLLNVFLCRSVSLSLVFDLMTP